MPALQDLQRQIKSAADLYTVVRTMKSLAAVSIRQYEEAVRALEGYFATVELGLHAVLRHSALTGTAERPQGTVALVLGSDQGMAGRFNDAIIEFAASALAQEDSPHGDRHYWVAGEKAAGGMEERFGGIAEYFPLPSSAQAITGVVQEVLLRFDARRREYGPCRLELYYNAPESAASYGQQRLPVLPPDPEWLRHMAGRPWPGRSLPLCRAAWGPLFAALVGEYLFVALFRAFAASLAAENAARLAAMQRAEKNIEELQEQLGARYHALRQSVITEELFDILGGFEALNQAED